MWYRAISDCLRIAYILQRLQADHAAITGIGIDGIPDRGRGGLRGGRIAFACGFTPDRMPCKSTLPRADAPTRRDARSAKGIP